MITTLRDWYLPRRRVLGWIGAGYTSFFAVFGCVYAFAPRVAPIEVPVDRLLFALQLAAAPAAVVMLVLQSLWRILDTVLAEDPLAGAETHRFKVNQRVMDNTLEQAAIFVPMFLAAAIRADPAHVYLLPMLMGTWCAGRLLFWGGYHVDPAWRAIGMDWTTCVALITAGWLIYTLT